MSRTGWLLWASANLVAGIYGLMNEGHVFYMNFGVALFCFGYALTD